MRPPSSSNGGNNDIGEEVKKGAWTPEEDQKLVDYIDKNGQGSWQLLPKKAGLNRCGKSCRLRWTNYLRPDIKRGSFSPHEDQTIIHLHSVLGNKWSMIASRLPGRTDNEIKNYWNTHLRKRLIRSGIDPKTHQPIMNYPAVSSYDVNSLIMNSNNNYSPVESLAKLRILCNILQVLQTNPSPIIPDPSEPLNMQYHGLVNAGGAVIPQPLLQVPSSMELEAVREENLLPNFEMMMPKLVDGESSKGDVIGSSSESIVPEDLRGDQLVVHSNDELGQILKYKDVFGANKSCDDVSWGEVIDDDAVTTAGGVGSVASCWKDVLDEFFSAS